MGGCILVVLALIVWLGGNREEEAVAAGQKPAVEEMSAAGGGAPARGATAPRSMIASPPSSRPTPARRVPQASGRCFRETPTDACFELCQQYLQSAPLPEPRNTADRRRGCDRYPDGTGRLIPLRR